MDWFYLRRMKMPNLETAKDCIEAIRDDERWMWISENGESLGDGRAERQIEKAFAVADSAIYELRHLKLRERTDRANETYNISAVIDILERIVHAGR